MSRGQFYLDKSNAKLAGVCAGLADYTGIDALWIRIGTALLVLAGFGSLLLIYLIVGLAADARPAALDDASPRPGLSASQSHWHERDGMLGDVESYYSASNPRLSREIDSLR